MNKFLTLGLAFSTALVMSSCSGTADDVTISDGNSNNSGSYNDYNNDDYNNDYGDTSDNFGYDNYENSKSIDIYDLEEGSYTITGYNNRGEDIELNFNSDGSYEYYRDGENFYGSFSIKYGEVQMIDDNGGSYVLAANNDELSVGGSYFCDALGRELTITSITGGSLY